MTVRRGQHLLGAQGEPSGSGAMLLVQGEAESGASNPPDPYVQSQGCVCAWMRLSEAAGLGARPCVLVGVFEIVGK